MIPAHQYYLANWIYPESFANLLKFRDDLIERLSDNKLSKTEREITIENIRESDRCLKEIMKRRQAAVGGNFEMTDEMKAFKKTKTIDTTKVTDIEVEDVMLSDYPDFCDAYIASATYDGRDMTEEELEELNDDTDFVYKAVIWSIS